MEILLKVHASFFNQLRALSVGIDVHGTSRYLVEFGLGIEAHRG